MKKSPRTKVYCISANEGSGFCSNKVYFIGKGTVSGKQQNELETKLPI